MSASFKMRFLSSCLKSTNWRSSSRRCCLTSSSGLFLLLLLLLLDPPPTPPFVVRGSCSLHTSSPPSPLPPPLPPLLLLLLLFLLFSNSLISSTILSHRLCKGSTYYVRAKRVFVCVKMTILRTCMFMRMCVYVCVYEKHVCRRDLNALFDLLVKTQITNFLA